MEIDINIGEMLTSFFKKKRVSKAALSRAIGINESSIRYHQNEMAIKTDLLLRYCSILKHNFFLDIAMQLPKDYTSDVPLDSQKDILIEQLQSEIKILQREKDLLKEVLKQ